MGGGLKSKLKVMVEILANFQKFGKILAERCFQHDRKGKGVA